MRAWESRTISGSGQNWSVVPMLSSSTFSLPDGTIGQRTHDGSDNLGYLYIGSDVASARTVDLGHGVLVDLDQDGRIVGVENLNGAVTDVTLAYVVRNAHEIIRQMGAPE